MLESLASKYAQIIVFDTETTGVQYRQDEIIELGILSASCASTGVAAVEEDDILIQLSAGRSLPPFITRLTGITEEMLRRDGISKEAASAVAERYFAARPLLLVSYNAQFDLCFLYYFLQRLGKTALLQGVHMLDAMTVYKDRRPYPHKLQNAVDAYGLSTQNTHRAVDDAHATLELLCAMEEERDDLHRYINLFGYNPKFGVPAPRISSVRYAPQHYEESRPLYETVLVHAT